MKKIFLFCIALLLLVPALAYAADYGNMYYVSYKDQYRVDYSYNSADVRYDLIFNASDGRTYTANYNFPPTGIHWLTCNGTYNMKFYDSSGTVLHTLGPMVTTQIIAPTCDSYPDGVSGKNDLGATTTGNSINWNALPTASNYEVWKDGSKVAETTGTSYNPTADGGYSVVARNSNGAVVGQSDLMYTSSSGGGGGGTPPPDYGTFDPNCPTCEQLWQLLQCPDWDKYMGEITKAIKTALPPPPNWDDIAEKIGTATINHLSDYFGPVPPPPTQDEVDGQLDKPSLPTVDATTPDADKLIPSVPAGYEQPKPFDITSGPQIEIKDESQPFQIFDPLHNIQYDAPGVPVVPGDTRNNTGGIEKPQNLTLPTPTPTPSNNIPPMPNDPLPVPSSSPGPGPIPSSGTIEPGPIPRS